MKYYLLVSPFSKCRISPLFENVTDALKFQIHTNQSGELKEFWADPDHVNEVIVEIDRTNHNEFQDWLDSLTDDEMSVWGIQRLS